LAGEGKRISGGHTRKVGHKERTTRKKRFREGDN